MNQQMQETNPAPPAIMKKIGCGISHKCTEANKKKNLAEIVSKQKESEQIITNVLKKVMEEKGAAKIEEVSLKQMNGGSNLTVTLGKRKVGKDGIVDTEVAAKMKKSLDLSNRETIKILKILRQGNVKVEKNVMGILNEIGRTLEDEYEDLKMEFDVMEKVLDEDHKVSAKKKSKRKWVRTEVDVTIAKDAKRLIQKVVEARELEMDHVKCRTVIDSGQGSLKIVTSIFQGDIDQLTQEGDTEKLTGANRLIILAEVEGGQETHRNVQQLLEKLQLHRLPGLVMVGDLSITNIYTGISKHGRKFACYQCESPSTTESCVLRTFRSLTEHYAAYVAAGSKPSQMQKFKNVINQCLLEADPEELVGNVLPLPELHLLLGVVTHFYKLLLKVWPPLASWGHGKFTVHGRHGGGLDGTNSLKFLKKLDLLATVVPPKLMPIIVVLKRFRSVVDGCFGWDLCWNYKQQISSFRDCLLKRQVYSQVGKLTMIAFRCQ